MIAVFYLLFLNPAIKMQTDLNFDKRPNFDTLHINMKILTFIYLIEGATYD